MIPLGRDRDGMELKQLVHFSLVFLSFVLFRSSQVGVQVFQLGEQTVK
jgi:hypothetical protein